MRAAAAPVRRGHISDGRAASSIPCAQAESGSAGADPIRAQNPCKLRGSPPGLARRGSAHGFQASPPVSQPTRAVRARRAAATRSTSARSLDGSSPPTSSSATRLAVEDDRERRSRAGVSSPGRRRRARVASPSSTKLIAARARRAARAGSRRPARRTSSASSPRLSTRSTASQRARVSAHASRSSPSKQRISVAVRRAGSRHGARAREVDEHERLRRRHHQRVVLHPVGGALVGRARPADPGGADEDLEQVVEARRRVVLDGRGAHDEVAARRSTAARGRGGGGTPSARGRSRAGSGRSRRSPARRCPRTRRARSPST